MYLPMSLCHIYFFEKPTKSLSSTHGNRWIFLIHKEIRLNVSFLLNSIVQEHFLMRYEFDSLGVVPSELSASLGSCLCSLNFLPCLVWKTLCLARVQFPSWSHLGSEAVTTGIGELDFLFQLCWHQKIL